MDFALDPQDEFPHDPGTAANYNESMYLNAFDHAGGWGGWFRLGNRPNEGRAEVSVCLYLPDGRVAFSFSRSDISGNGELAAGGLRIDVVEPLQRLRFTFAGPCLLLDDPSELADPGAAYRTNQQTPVTVELDVEGIAPAWGGRPLAEDGSPLVPPDPEHSFAAAHYEQHVRVTGTVRVGTATYPMAGFGLRDKSWGPRHWAAVSWYRFLPVTFGDDLAMMLLVKDEAAAAGGIVVSGEVSRDGVRTPIRHCTIDTDWDATGRPTSLVARAELADGTSYLVHGDVLSLVPLRSRRTGSDGRVLTTRITESMTRFTCGDRVALGISEYLDQIVDGVPVGPDNPVIGQ